MVRFGTLSLLAALSILATLCVGCARAPSTSFGGAPAGTLAPLNSADLSLISEEIGSVNASLNSTESSQLRQEDIDVLKSQELLTQEDEKSLRAFVSR